MIIQKPELKIFISKSQHRVLYADTDAMGIVYNGTYFRFFEKARTDYLINRAMPYSEIEKRGIRTPLTESYAHYYNSFYCDDVIEIRCWISEIKRASFRFDYHLYVESEPDNVRVAGFTRLAILDKATQKVSKIPEWLLEYLK